MVKIKEEVLEHVAMGGNWLKKAVPKSHRGLLHKQLGIPEDEVIPQDVLEKATKSNDPTLRRRAQFALNTRKFNRGSRRS